MPSLTSTVHVLITLHLISTVGGYGIQPAPAPIQHPYGQTGICQVGISMIPSSQVSSSSYSPGPSGATQLECGELIKCYTHTPNIAIANGAPFERRSEIGCAKCLELCEKKRSPNRKYICQSVIYDYGRSVCDLYAVTGDVWPQCLASLQGYNYFKPTGACGPTAEAVPEVTLRPVTGMPSIPPPLSEIPPSPVEPTAVVRFECPSNTRPKSFLIHDFEGTSVPTTPVKVVSKQQCYTACLENQDGERKPLPLNAGCQSAVYKSGECKLSTGKIDFQDLSKTPGSEMMTIRCYSSLRPCPHPYRFYPQRVLVGYARQVVDADNEDECVQQCLDVQAFRCKSGMFFAEDRQQNCILNTETEYTKQHLFTDEHETFVIFFDLDCVAAQDVKVEKKKKNRASGRQANQTNKVLKDDPDWTEWSPCNKLTAKSYRYKRCADRDIRRCQRQERKCIPLQTGQKYELTANDAEEILQWLRTIKKLCHKRAPSECWKAILRRRSLDCLMDRMRTKNNEIYFTRHFPYRSAEHNRRSDQGSPEATSTHPGADNTAAWQSRSRLMETQDKDNNNQNYICRVGLITGLRKLLQDHYDAVDGLYELDNLWDILIRLEAKEHGLSAKRRLRMTIERLSDEIGLKDKYTKNGSNKLEKKKLKEELLNYKKAYIKCLLNSAHVSNAESQNTPTISLPYEDVSAHLDRVQCLVTSVKKYNSAFPSVEAVRAPNSYTDVYGFVHQYHDDTEALLYITSLLNDHLGESECAEKERSWKTWLHSTARTEISNTKELRTMIRDGIPAKYRGGVWTKLIDRMTQGIKAKYGRNYFHSLICLSDAQLTKKVQPISRKQINLDLMRTMPSNIHFNNSPSKGVKQLQQVLYAFAIHNPKVGYCQGINFIVATALLFVSPENAFWLLVAITQCYFSDDYYDSMLTGARVSQEVLKDVLAVKAPKLVNNYALCDFDPSVVTLNWFISLFFDSVPFSVMLRIWDCFLLEGPKVIYRFTTALLVMFQNETTKDTDNISKIRFLRCAVKNMNDADSLVKVAFQTLKPFPKRKELIAIHGQHAARIKENALRLQMLHLQVREPTEEPCNVDQCKHIQAKLHLPDTDKIFICFGANKDSQIGMIDIEKESLFILCDRLSNMCTSITASTDGCILLAATIAHTLIAFGIDTTERKCKQLWEISIQDVIMDMTCQGSTLYGGLLNGSLIYIQNISDSAPNHSDLFYISVAECIPIHRLLITDDAYLWMAVGNQIFIYESSTLDKVEQIKENNISHNMHKVSCMEYSPMGIWIAWTCSNTVDLWDQNFFTCIQSIQLEETNEDAANKEDSLVSSVRTLEDTVWIGTHTGRLLVYRLGDADRLGSGLYRPHSCDSCFNQGLIFYCCKGRKGVLRHRDSGFSEKTCNQLNSDPCLSPSAEKRMEPRPLYEDHESASLSNLDSLRWERDQESMCASIKMKPKHSINHTSIVKPPPVMFKIDEAPHQMNHLSRSSEQSLSNINDSSSRSNNIAKRRIMTMRANARNRYCSENLGTVSSIESLHKSLSGSCVSVISHNTTHSIKAPSLLLDSLSQDSNKSAVYLSVIRHNTEEPIIISYTGCFVRTGQVQLWTLDSAGMPVKLRNFSRLSKKS